MEETTTPSPSPTQVVVETRASLISAGTERSLRGLASASLIAKARARPDLVRQVIDRARATGLRSTAKAVRSRLAEDMPLGYSAAGVVVSVGEAVSGTRPGQRVATAGAPHADLQVVSSNLTVPLPEEVDFEAGAFSTLASISLNGLRLAEIGTGSRVVVVGLGIVGQLTARLAAASGTLVAAVEPDPGRRDIATRAGIAAFDSTDAGWEGVASWTAGSGADAVLVTAATDSSQPLRMSAAAARDRAVLVLVGDAGMDLDRRPFYERELTLRVARSYGPGRYDPSYEDLGVDYPPGHVRWTAQRNMEAFLSLVAAGRLDISDLVTHRYAFTDALAAYELLESDDRSPLGILLEYPGSTDRMAHDRPTPTRQASTMEAAIVGTGRFARDVLIPAATGAGFAIRGFHSVTGGLPSSSPLADATPESEPVAILESERYGIVFVATRHDTHASLTAAALRAGKHVFCEKPLAIDGQGLEEVEAALASSSGALMVGFNRRWSDAVGDAVAALGPGGPLQIMYRINAGELPAGHWLADRRMGGRLLGEGCHFVDTCSAIVGSHPRSVTAITSGTGELILDENFTLLLGYGDGSQATIVYASDSSTRPGKERIEVLGRGRSVVIDDFGLLQVDGPGGRKTTRYRPPDKGHGAELEAFSEIVSGTRANEASVDDAVATTRVMLAAVESAMTGTTVRTGL